MSLVSALVPTLLAPKANTLGQYSPGECCKKPDKPNTSITLAVRSKRAKN